MDFTIDDILHSISFLFTIILILIGITKGLGDIELLFNIIYFTTLNITLLRYLLREK